jgi:RimJ/RimL family protein N-acetyltransferase
VLDSDLFADKPPLTGERVYLVPLGPEHADAFLATLDDDDVNRLTGTHREFTREEIEQWCVSRAEQPDRLDYAVIDRETRSYLGELAINDFDADNASCSFRIALGAHALGQGFGTDATRLIVDHVLGLGMHRIALEVYDFNPRARHVYENVGFVHEGTLRHALRWDGAWVDAHVMAIVSE